jgi:hypothetical protein
MNRLSYVSNETLWGMTDNLLEQIQYQKKLRNKIMTKIRLAVAADDVTLELVALTHDYCDSLDESDRILALAENVASEMRSRMA